MNVEQTMERIAIRYPEYPADAYQFIYNALIATTKQIQQEGEQRSNLSAEELYIGTCMQAIQHYGPLAYQVFKYWNILSASNIGDIVYKLIDANILGKQEGDHQVQFDQLPDIEEMLERPFCRD